MAPCKPCLTASALCTFTGQYPGMYPPTSQPTSSIHPASASIHPPPTSSILAGAAAVSAVSEEEERRHFEESERIKRQSLESAVEDKIRRHVKQVLDSAKVCCTQALRSKVGVTRPHSHLVASYCSIIN